MIASFEEIYKGFLDFKTDRWVWWIVLIKKIRINKNCQFKIWKAEWNHKHNIRIDERWFYQNENGRSVVNVKITCDEVDLVSWRVLDLD